MPYKQFDLDHFTEACMTWGAPAHSPFMHRWFDEPMQWPEKYKYLPNAGVTADWGETFPNGPEELTGAEQIQRMLNLMGRVQWTPNTLVLITTHGDHVELTVDWYEEVSPRNMRYYRPVEIVNGVQYRAGRRPWLFPNVWPGKIMDPDKRKRAGLTPDPSYADMVAMGVRG